MRFFVELKNKLQEVSKSNKTLIILGIVISIGGVLEVSLGVLTNFLSLKSHFDKPQSQINESNKLTNEIHEPECNFSNVKSNDSLYILVTRFEDYITKSETYCFGRSLEERIDFKSKRNKLPIQVCYLENYSPKSISQAQELQKKYGVDLVLWGQLKNVELDCSKGDFCFKSQPSINLINLVGGTIPLEKYDLNYENEIGPSEIEQGAFHVDSLTFDYWLTAIHNIKIGKNNPDLYTIDEDLPPKKKANELLQKSRLFSTLGKYSKAIETLNLALEKDPTNAELFNELGVCFNFLKLLDKSIFNFTKAIQFDNKKTLYYLNRGSIYYYKNDLKLALSDFLDAYSRDTKNVMVISNISTIYYNLGKAKQALDYNDMALKLDSSNSSILGNRARFHLGNEQFDLANVYFQKGFKVNRIDKNILNMGLEISSRLKDLETFNTLISIIANVYPNDVVFDKAKCAGYYNIREYDKCTAMSKKLELVNEKDAGLFFAIGSSYYNKKEYNSAISFLSRAIMLKNSEAVYYFNRGMSFENNKNYTNAYEDLKMALKLEPKNKLILDELKYIEQKIQKK